MGIVAISRAEFDPTTMMLNFAVSTMLDECPMTVVSSIKLDKRPTKDCHIRWAIMQRSAELLQ